MLTEREKEVIASFKPWMKAFKNNDAAGMIEAAEGWYSEDKPITQDVMWTAEEDELLRRAFRAGIKDASAVPGRTQKATCQRRHALGLVHYRQPK